VRFRVAILGTEVFAIELARQDPAELLAAAITELQGEPEDSNDPGNQFGVSHCHIERSPDTDYAGEEEDKGFGFGKIEA
jgi:hypothetical protein